MSLECHPGYARSQLREGSRANKGMQGGQPASMARPHPPKPPTRPFTSVIKSRSHSYRPSPAWVPGAAPSQGCGTVLTTPGLQAAANVGRVWCPKRRHLFRRRHFLGGFVSGDPRYILMVGAGTPKPVVYFLLLYWQRFLPPSWEMGLFSAFSQMARSRYGRIPNVAQVPVLVS